MLLLSNILYYYSLLITVLHLISVTNSTSRTTTSIAVSTAGQLFSETMALKGQVLSFLAFKPL